MMPGDPRRGPEASEDPPAPDEPRLDGSLSSPTSGSFWGISVIGGAFSTLLVFVFLGYLQPTMSSSEAISLPDIVQLQTGLGSNRKPPPPPKQEKQEKQERKSQTKRAQKPVRRTVARTKPTRAQQNVRQLNALSSLSIGLNLGPGIGGPSMAIAIPDSGEYLEEAREVEEYLERRERVKRESKDRHRGGGAGAFVGVTPPRRINRPRMPYPQKARKEELEGFVLINVLISPNGSISEFEILGARPEDVFEDAVIESLPQWRFSPAKDIAGRPIEMWKDYKIEFKLEDAE